MTLKNRIAKRKRAKTHLRIQKERRLTTLNEAAYAARYIGSDGLRLKQQRTGKKFTTALAREMDARGYQRVGDTWMRKPKVTA